MRRLLLIVIMVVAPLIAWAGSYTLYEGPIIPAAGGGSGTWVYNNSHTPTSGDATVPPTSGYHFGGYVTAPSWATKITKLRLAIYDSYTAGTIWICAYPQGGGSSLGGGSGAAPGGGSYTLYNVDTGTLNISVTGGTTYAIMGSLSDSSIVTYYANEYDGLYSEDDYAGACVSSVTPSTDSGYGHCVGAFFE